MIGSPVWSATGWRGRPALVRGGACAVVGGRLCFFYIVAAAPARRRGTQREAPAVQLAQRRPGLLAVASLVLWLAAAPVVCQACGRAWREVQQPCRVWDGAEAGCCPAALLRPGHRGRECAWWLAAR